MMLTEHGEKNWDVAVECAKRYQAHISAGMVVYNRYEERIVDIDIDDLTHAIFHTAWEGSGQKQYAFIYEERLNNPSVSPDQFEKSYFDWTVNDPKEMIHVAYDNPEMYKARNYDVDDLKTERSSVTCGCGNSEFLVNWIAYPHTGGYCKLTCKNCDNERILIDDYA